MLKLNTKRILLPSQIETSKLHMYMQITPVEDRSAPTVQVNIPRQQGRAADLRELAEVLNEAAQLLQKQETDQLAQAETLSPLPSEAEPKGLGKPEEPKEAGDIAHVLITKNFRATVVLRHAGTGVFNVQFGETEPDGQYVAQSDLYELGRFFCAVADKMKG